MSELRRAQMLREVLGAVRLGEDSGYDFKEVDAGPRPFARTDAVADDLCAFANARGGRIVLGVSDDPPRVVKGIALQDLDRVEQIVREIARDKVEPLVSIDTWRLEVPDTAGEMRAVLVVDVPRSLFVHRSPGGYRKRFGASQREMTTEELQRLLQSRSQTRSISFDEFPVAGTGVADLDLVLASRFARDGRTDDATLSKLHLLVRNEDGLDELSVGALLLCTPAPHERFPGAWIQCVQYPTVLRSAGGQLDAFDATGPLDRQIDDALAWVQRRTTVRASKLPWRVEVRAYDTLALFEAIVNAVVHRDYSIRGSHIRLHLFPNRLELYSPGALANTLSVEALEDRQYVRNTLIASLLGRLGVRDTPDAAPRHYLERRGDGVPIIYERSERLSGVRPMYELIADAELKLTIYAQLPA